MDPITQLARTGRAGAQVVNAALSALAKPASTEAISYLLRDLFSTDAAAPLGSPRRCVPGPGTWVITDVEAQAKTLGSALRNTGQPTSAVWGECRIVGFDSRGMAFARKQGRAFSAVVTQEYYRDDYAVMWAESATPGAPDAAGVGFMSDYGGKYITDPAGIEVLSNSSYANTVFQYLIVLVLQETGCYVLVSAPAASHYLCDAGDGLTDTRWDVFGQIPAYPQAKLWWVDRVSTTTPLYPAVTWEGRLGNATDLNGFALEDARVVDIKDSQFSTLNGQALLYDTFTAADGTNLSGHVAEKGGTWELTGGTWAITSGSASRTDATDDIQAALLPAISATDYVVQGVVTIPAGTSVVDGIILRYQDINNFVWFGASADLVGLYKCEGGVISAIQTRSWAATAQTREFRLYVSGDTYRCLMDNFNATFTVHDEFLEASPRVGLVANGAGANFTYADLVAFPLAVTLPAEIQTGCRLHRFTPGAVLASDTFTGDAGDLEAHAPEVGATWEVYAETDPPGAMALDGAGKLGYTAPVADNVWAVMEVGTADVECEVTITLPADASDAVGGIANYIDATHWFAVRIIRRDSTSPVTHEIELWHKFDGFADVPKMTSFIAMWLDGSTHTLKCQFSSDNNLVHYYLNGLLAGSYYSPVAWGTKFGLHGHQEDNGTKFDNWSVKEL